MKKWNKLLLTLIIVSLVSVKGWNMYMDKQLQQSNEISYMTEKAVIDKDDIYYLQKGEGDKTVVFLSGSGVNSSYLDMYPLWNEVSKYSKVFLYDRPGMGNSSITKRPRDIDTVVSEFNEVLEESGQKEPYVLVAHSMASLQAIRFAQMYPEKVDSIIFIDGASPSFCEEFKDPMKSMVHVLGAMRKTGLLRALSIFSGFKSQFEVKQDISEELQELNVQMSLKNLWNSNMIKERKAIQENGKKVKESGSLKDIKLVVISAGNNGFDNWQTYEKELANMSQNSEFVYVEDSGHFIHHEYSELVINKIKEMLDK
ncbi:MAG: alpha/beta hydrolase [Clostridium butyricum]|nr:alpha/beta hydrolase [Clostridium butyricum]